jgi:MraZ protein
MSANAAIETIYYNSLYRHGVDEKRRVQIPSKWRPSQPGVEFTLILWPKHRAGACLRALPPEQMAALKRDIDAMPNADQSKVVLKRLIGSSSVQATVDKAGRICIPEEMATAADITDVAVLVGLLDRFEIWSPKRHADVTAADAVMAPQAFDMME